MIEIKKICITCKEEKPAEEFRSILKRKDGLGSYCKDCIRISGRQYRLEKKESIKEQGKQYRQRNSERLKKKSHIYYQENRERFRLNSHIYRDNNKEKIREQRRRSRERNKETIREQKILHYRRNRERLIKKAVENRKKLRLEDPSRRALDSCRARLRQFLRASNLTKLCVTRELIGCTEKELIKYLEDKFKPGMTWANYGLHGWHIDHIKSCSSFKNFEKVEVQRKCFHYTNLQPLWAKENLFKGAK